MQSSAHRLTKWRTPDLDFTGSGTEKNVCSCRAAQMNWGRFNQPAPKSRNTGTNQRKKLGFEAPIIQFNPGKSPATGVFKMASHRVLLFTAALSICQTAWTQSPTYGVGRTPSAEEIRAWDISISPTGKELPSGHGTAKEGAALYVRKGCAGCHGATGSSGGHSPKLISSKDAHATANLVPCLAPCVNDRN